MKIQLETIPVTRAWKEASPCAICSLLEAAEHRHVDYFLGNSVMNPETRVEVNETGFCSRHFPMLREAGKAHHLGLIAHTRLQTVRAALAGSLKGLRQNPSRRSASSFSAEAAKIRRECMVCRSLERDLQRYAGTAAILHAKEEEFRRLFTESPGPCIRHAADLADLASEVLAKRDLTRFLADLASHLDNELRGLEADVLHFTRKFDARNDELEWGNARNAHARAVQALSGVSVRLTEE